MQECNFYVDGQRTPYAEKLSNVKIQEIWSQLKASANFEKVKVGASVCSLVTCKIHCRVRMILNYMHPFEYIRLSMYADFCVCMYVYIYKHVHPSLATYICEIKTIEKGINALNLSMACLPICSFFSFF